MQGKGEEERFEPLGPRGGEEREERIPWAPGGVRGALSESFSGGASGLAAQVWRRSPWGVRRASVGGPRLKSG